MGKGRKEWREGKGKKEGKVGEAGFCVIGVGGDRRPCIAEI